MLHAIENFYDIENVTNIIHISEYSYVTPEAECLCINYFIS